MKTYSSTANSHTYDARRARAFINLLLGVSALPLLLLSACTPRGGNEQNTEKQDGTMEKKTLIVVDCQNDFISGSLACTGADSAVMNIIRYINDNSDDITVLYSMDWHSPKHSSFKENGGPWPAHCVQGQEGAEIASPFSEQILCEAHRPNAGNKFLKGANDAVEEYSAYKAKNAEGKELCEFATKEVIVCGLASEYCVRETALELLRDGFHVTFLRDAVGFVNEADHLKNLEELANKGITMQ